MKLLTFFIIRSVSDSLHEIIINYNPLRGYVIKVRPDKRNFKSIIYLPKQHSVRAYRQSGTEKASVSVPGDNSVYMIYEIFKLLSKLR